MSVRADLGNEAVARLFGNSNVAPLMRILTAAPEREYSVSQLMDLAGLSSKEGTQRAVEALLGAGWLKERREGRERLLRANDDVLVVPPNPYAHVPEGFREVVRHVVQRILKESKVEIWQVVLFGGLAVGRGDRLSDLDLLVVTPSQRPVRRTGNRLVDELRKEGFRGQRYVLHLLVETPETLRQRKADSSLPVLLRQAIPLWSDPRFPLEVGPEPGE